MLWLWHSLYESAAMFWEVFWALVLGFTISGVFQVFVSKAQMTKAFGTADLKAMALATAFGAASSSCSYAAVATAKTAFKKGAALAPTLAFMFASTNLVFELGFVIWLLLGWRFVLAEFVGAFVLIAVMWALLRLTEPKGLEQEARDHSEEGAGGHDHSMGGQTDKFTQVADAFVMGWSMLWREMLIGFLIAGFLSVLFPTSWWQTLFLAQHPGPGRLLENVVVGPLIAVASFVCSVGNIPLASILWSGGISFGGVLAFIYADLIIVPLIVAYKKYYGMRTALYITSVMFVSMALAGLGVDLLFHALHLVPTGPRPASAVARAGFHWNYTTYLDIVAVAVAGCFAWRHYKSPMQMDTDHAHHA
jgi:uncharacterized membrane protein YraQ (UPF0718 family)